MKCSTMDCRSLAVARSPESDRFHCVECAIKIVKRFGPESIVSLPMARLPWEYPIANKCPACGVGYNRYLIGNTGDCPSCRRPLIEYHNSWESKKVIYKEGPHD